MQKNTAGKWIVFAYGSPAHATLAGLPITGDAANITANIRLDGGAANAVDDTNPAELEDGYYVFDITATESNADLLSMHPASATANVIVIGVPGALYTTPANLDARITTIDDLIDTEIGTLVGLLDTEIATIVAAVAASAIRSALGLGAANLDGQLGTIGTNVSNNGTAISAISVPTTSAIKTAFTTGDPIPVNVTQVNSIPIDGAGTTLDPWGPA